MPAPEDKILTTPLDGHVALPTSIALACKKNAVVTLGQAFVLLHRLRKQSVAGYIQEVSAKDLIVTAFRLCGLLADRLEYQSGLVEHASGALPPDPGEDNGPAPEVEPRAGRHVNDAEEGDE